jgi:hypothetical protein
MERAAPFIVIACLASLLCVPAAAETRVPSELELKAFHTYYQRQFPDNHANQPTFSITRVNAADPWDVSAYVDSQPQRGLRALCRMQRIDFKLDGRWAAAERQRQYVWLDQKQCRAPARPVELKYPMPDADVLGLLERQHALLKSARLLFGGNTACARQRALNFSLARIDVGTSGSSSEVLAGLEFESDRNTSATVWVRRSGLDYNAWNVSCS